MTLLRECGGAAILGAAAFDKPVIAIKWGGLEDYASASRGVPVAPDSREGFTNGLANAMVRLARSSELRREFGEGGKLQVSEDCLDWESKADRVFLFLNEVPALKWSHGL